MVQKSIVEALFTSDSVEESIELVESICDQIEAEWIPVCRNSESRLDTGVKRCATLAEHTPNIVDSYVRMEHGDDADFGSLEKAVSAVSDLDEKQSVMRISGNSDVDATNFTFADAAGGQDVEDLDKFAELGDTDRSKYSIPYLHGRRSKGHLTSVRYLVNAGGYKVIATSTPESDLWGILVFRWSEEDDAYQYLTDDGEFLSVAGELDFGNNIGCKSQGTVSRLIGFDIEYRKDKRTVSKFVRKFANNVVNPYVPLCIVDTINDETLEYSGLLDIVHENEDLFDFTGSTEAHDEVFGSMCVHVAIPKERCNMSKDEKRTVNSVTTTDPEEDNVILCVDGHKHFGMSSNFLSSQLGMDEVESDAVIIVELTDGGDRDSLFNDNRNGFSDSKHKSRFRDVLVDVVDDMDEIENIDTDRAVREDGSDKQFRVSDLPNDPDLGDLLECDDLDSVHRSQIDDLNCNKFVPVIYEVVQQSDETDILENLNLFINKCQPYVEAMGRMEGKDSIPDYRSQAVGQINEILTYLQIVEIVDGSGAKCLYNPSLGSLPNVEADADQSPDMDIGIVSEDEETIHVFSLKTSFRERIKQSAYWYLKLKLPARGIVSKIPNFLSDRLCDLLEHSMFLSKDAEIKYGYISPILNGSANTKVLDEFDMGYVPSEEVMSDRDNQYSLSDLSSWLNENF